MRTEKLGLALIGLCGLMCGQTAGTGSITGMAIGGGSGTAILSSGTLTSNSAVWCGSMDGGSCLLFGGDIEKRSIKDPMVTLQQVKITAHKIPASQIPAASYMKTAKAINLKSPAIDEAQLAQIIVDHGFSIYEYSKVDNYLYHMALKQGTNVRWVWKPMRDEDAKGAAGQQFQTFDGMGRISAGSVYAKAIPERVLAKVECLLNELPEAVFLVSDYEVSKPDPFLAVTTPRMLQAHRIFIVDQWDEPGFTERPIVKPYDEDKALEKQVNMVKAPVKPRDQVQMENTSFGGDPTFKWPGFTTDKAVH